MKKLLVMSVVLATATWVLAADMQFAVNRDAGNDMNAVHTSGGADPNVRGAKNPWDEDTSYYDWDTAAVDAWINANGGRAQVASVEFFIKPYTCPGQGTTVGIQVFTLQSQNDWAEGDGTAYNGGSWNWTQGTPSSTYSNAREYWLVNDNGTPGDTSDDFNQMDAAQTVPWLDAGGTARSINATQLRGMQNSVDWDPGDVGDVYYGVALDTAFWTDILDNANNRGIILWDELDAPNPDENWQVHMREDAGGANAAYLKVTMVPEPASMTLLVLGGLGVLLRKKR